MPRATPLLFLLAVSACDLAKRVTPPQGRVLGQRIDEGLVGLDFAATVFCSVANVGGDGDITVTAMFSQGSGSWTEQRSVRLASGQHTELTFVFTQAKALGGNARYGCVIDS
jgi:hypothetical protein